MIVHYVAWSKWVMIWCDAYMFQHHKHMHASMRMTHGRFELFQSNFNHPLLVDIHYSHRRRNHLSRRDKTERRRAPLHPQKGNNDWATTFMDIGSLCYTHSLPRSSDYCVQRIETSTLISWHASRTTGTIPTFNEWKETQWSKKLTWASHNPLHRQWWFA